MFIKLLNKNNKTFNELLSAVDDIYKPNLSQDELATAELYLHFLFSYKVKTKDIPNYYKILKTKYNYQIKREEIESLDVNSILEYSKQNSLNPTLVRLDMELFKAIKSMYKSYYLDLANSVGKKVNIDNQCISTIKSIKALTNNLERDDIGFIKSEINSFQHNSLDNKKLSETKHIVLNILEDATTEKTKEL